MKTTTTLGILVAMSAVIAAGVLAIPGLAGAAYAESAVGGTSAGGGGGGGGASSGPATVSASGSGGLGVTNIQRSFTCEDCA